MSDNKIFNLDSTKYLSYPNDSSEIKYKLAFYDPPYNINVEYDGFSDRLDWSTYYKNLQTVMNLMYNMCDGFVVWVLPPEITIHLHQRVMASQVKFTHLDTVVWARSFGNQSNYAANLSRGYTNVVIYSTNKYSPKWDRIKVPSDRQTKYNDSRANPDGKIPSNVWDIPMVCGTHAERVGWHPAQLPIELVKRIILGLTDEDDWVFDGYSGSATVSYVCKKLNRNSVAQDINENYKLKGLERCE